MGDWGYGYRNCCKKWGVCGEVQRFRNKTIYIFFKFQNVLFFKLYDNCVYSVVIIKAGSLRNIIILHFESFSLDNSTKYLVNFEENNLKGC